MSFKSALPEALTAAADTLLGVGSGMNARNAAATGSTTAVVPAAADDVWALTAAPFATHAQMYPAVSPHSAAMREKFMKTLRTRAGSYATAEAANAIAAG
jgi:hypothetical protein